MALRYSLGLPEAAAAVDQAVDDVLAAGIRTADISGSGPTASTYEMGNAVARALAM
jgi:3-isopropylmalate dehydrogenase